MIADDDNINDDDGSRLHPRLPFDIKPFEIPLAIIFLFIMAVAISMAMRAIQRMKLNPNSV